MAGWTKMPLGTEVDLGQGDFVLDGDPAPLPKKGVKPPPNFRLISIVAKWLDASRWQLVIGMEVGLGPGHIVLDGNPASPPKKGGGTAPNFRPISIVAKRLDGSRCHLVWRQALTQATLC